MKTGDPRVCRSGLLLSQLLVIAVVIPGASSQVSCDGERPCVVNEDGAVSYDNGQVYRTAVGCIKSFTVNFRAGVAVNASANAPSVSICERQPSGACTTKPGAILTDFQKRCCRVPFHERPAACSAAPEMGTPMDVFQCMELTSHQGATGLTNATLRFMAPFESDLQNQGQVEVCLVASLSTGEASDPFCVVFQVERCSTCLEDGEGLAKLARRHGTHWTQLYTTNPEIDGDPDKVIEGQVVRLGMIYRVKPLDTLMSIALKFGVSINQIFGWNPFLEPMPFTGGRLEDRTGMTRDLPPGLDLCILPKTCLTTFGDNQPLNFLSESSLPGEGGWWSDARQVSTEPFQVGIPEGGVPQW